MTVVFRIPGASPVTIECVPGENLMEAARRAGVTLDAPCGGSGTCGKCRVRLLEGELESAPSRHLSDADFREGWRLACCSRVTGDCAVEIPETASVFRSRMKISDLKGSRERAAFEKTRQFLAEKGMGVQHPFLNLTLAMTPPSEEDPAPDAGRLTHAIGTALPGAAVEITFPVLKKLPHVLREQNFRVNVKGRLENGRFSCMDVCPVRDTVLAGCAIDIGTTSVCAVLMDLDSGEILAGGSLGNGQIPYGADVINRIIRQSRPGGRELLQKAILEDTLIPLLTALCAEAGITPESILRLSVAANTTMNHLLLGIDADPIRKAPYVPCFFSWEGLRAGDLGLPANPAAEVILAPNIGSYVGGDITAGTLAGGIWDDEEMSLFIDLGTNGEIVFGNRDFLLSCACSAGPAFEGGDISCGMRAADGAIEACVIDKETMEPTLSVIGGKSPVGICGSGLIDIIAGLFRCGIIDPRGRFCREGARIRRDEHGCGRYVLSETGGREIALTEVDIDNFIRAKGAVYSAVRTLLDCAGLTADCIDRVCISGGIGSGISIENAVCIGMLPDVPREKYRYIGNSSLSGAYALAVSAAAEARCRAIAANMTYVELSTCPGYMDAFIAACFLPHTDGRLFPSAAI